MRTRISYAEWSVGIIIRVRETRHETHARQDKTIEDKAPDHIASHVHITSHHKHWNWWPEAIKVKKWDGCERMEMWCVSNRMMKTTGSWNCANSHTGSCFALVVFNEWRVTLVQYRIYVVLRSYWPLNSYVVRASANYTSMYSTALL